jgi:formate hydrogenlyase subunit 3/multisubunit Na+/H+ antiporter MnhD subunit
MTQNAHDPHFCDPHFWMTAPMILLAGLCIAIGLLPSLFIIPLTNVLEIIVTPFSIQNTLQNTLNDIFDGNVTG